LCHQGQVTRGWLGIFIHKLRPPPAVRRSVELPEGALAVSVVYVVPGSPAESGGIRAGDVILKFAGRSFSSAGELRRQIAGTPPGTEAAVAFWRGEAVMAPGIAIGSRPAVPPHLPGEKEWGLRLHSQMLADESVLTLGEFPNAVVVQAVEARSRARGLAPQDVILSVNGVSTPNLETFCREAIRICAQQPSRSVQLEVTSQGSAPRTVKLGDE
jgi:serine protease Do